MNTKDRRPSLCKVSFLLTSGASVTLETPLSREEFDRIYMQTPTDGILAFDTYEKDNSIATTCARFDRKHIVFIAIFEMLQGPAIITPKLVTP